MPCLIKKIPNKHGDRHAFFVLFLDNAGMYQYLNAHFEYKVARRDCQMWHKTFQSGMLNPIKKFDNMGLTEWDLPKYLPKGKLY